MATQKTDWVQLNPYPNDSEEEDWHADTQRALETLSAGGLVEWKPSGDGFLVRVLPASPSSSSETQVPSPSATRNDALARLEAHYAKRGWVLLRDDPAYRGSSIVSSLNERGQKLRDRRLDDDLYDDGDHPVLAVRRGVDEVTEVVTFDRRDGDTIRLALETMAPKLPLEWSESGARVSPTVSPSPPTSFSTREPSPKDEGESGWKFEAKLEWPDDAEGRAKVEAHCRPDGYIVLVGDDEPEQRREDVLRGLMLLMRGTDGFDIGYTLCDDVLGAIPPWVQERRNREYREAYGRADSPEM